MNKRMAAVITLAGVIGTGTIAHAQQYETTLTPPTEGPQTLQDWLNQTQVSGTVRAYDFDRLYGASKVPNQSSFSVAGILNAKSAPFLGGFGVGVSFFTATSLGLNNTTETGSSFPHLDTTLAGPHNDLTALGQAYVQYQKPRLLLRVGDQELNTPWVGESDSRVLPATYQAAFAEVTPAKALNLFGFREFAWKSRTSDTYYQDNLYYPSTFDGDSSYGGTASLSGGVPKARGTLALGATYAANGIKAEAWYYDYYNFANMFYDNANYTLDTGTGFNPFIAEQFLQEWDGNSLLNTGRFGSAIDGYKGNGVNSTAYGVQAGLNYTLKAPDLGTGILALSYNAVPVHPGSVGDGAIVSPYTIGYATDPLYTTALIRGLVELGPGDAKRISFTQHFFNNRILAVVAFSRFDTKLNGGSNDTYADITYFPFSKIKGLSIRDRMEVSNANSQYNNGATGNIGQSFIYNRVMFQYNF
jgi:outer membrane porin, OprD family